MQIKSKLKFLIKKFLYKKGIKTNRQIIVFESDDWGAIRNSSVDAINGLIKQYPGIKKDSYTLFDCLENKTDILELKKVLTGFKDSKGDVAKFTLNYVTANVDFDKVKKSDYTKIYYRPLAEEEAYKNVLDLVKLGVKDGVFAPQLHTREHFNSQFLLSDLKAKGKERWAFEMGILGVADDNYNGLDTLNQLDNTDLLTQGMDNFINLFGYKSTTFIAPCYVWSEKDEKILKGLGVKALQGKIFQNIPLGRDCYKKKFHKFGGINKKTEMQYFYRNCFFEPSKSRLAGKTNNQIVADVLKEIDFAFSCKKPAIICSHRVNYVGGIDKNNRIENLKCLNGLLEKVTKKYPNVEFMSTDEFYKEIKNDKNNKT